MYEGAAEDLGALTHRGFSQTRSGRSRSRLVGLDRRQVADLDGVTTDVNEALGLNNI